MKLDSLTTPRPLANWSRIDAGRRAQVQHQPAGIRHFRLPGIGVKRAAAQTNGSSPQRTGLFFRQPPKRFGALAAASLVDFTAS